MQAIEPVGAMIPGKPAERSRVVDKTSQAQLDETFDALTASAERKKQAVQRSRMETAEANARLAESISAAHRLDPARVAALIADVDEG